MLLFQYAALMLLASSAASATEAEVLSVQIKGRAEPLVGELVVEAQDGGLLLIDELGVLWTIEPKQLEAKKTLDAPLVALPAKEAGIKLVGELPPGFDVLTSPHYVVCFDTSRGYAQWCSSLLERLHRGFVNFWTKRGVKLTEPRFPLPVIIFADRERYHTAAKPDVGDAVERIVGYYNLKNNRITMFDLTGAAGKGGRGRGTTAEINQMLSQPAAADLVATVVHEATHQIAYNTGMHRRLADVPLWVGEGMAIYFETPDLDATGGWRTIGHVNNRRLPTAVQGFAVRKPDALAQLTLNDDLFRDPKRGVEAYAEAWALNFYLLKKKSAAYVGYLKVLQEKGPLVQDTPEERAAEFRAAFGAEEALDRDFAKSTKLLKPAR